MDCFLLLSVGDRADAVGAYVGGDKDRGIMVRGGVLTASACDDEEIGRPHRWRGLPNSVKNLTRGGVNAIIKALHG